MTPFRAYGEVHGEVGDAEKKVLDLPSIQRCRDTTTKDDIFGVPVEKASVNLIMRGFSGRRDAHGDMHASN
jgi:hypothetical protein